MKDRIKQVRKDHNLTQQEFADRIGVKRSSLTNYEVGRNVPIDAIIISICKEFKVNEEWLRTGNGEKYLKRTRNQMLAEFINSTMETEDDSFKKSLVLSLSQFHDSDWDALERMINIITQNIKDRQN